MKKKIKNICIMLSIFLTITTDNVYGAGVNSYSQWESETGNSNQEVEPTSWKGYQDGNKKYQYRYKKIINTSNSIQINAYDLSGNSIIPNSVTEFSTKSKAGTWIGINVEEQQTAKWKVWNFEFQEIKKVYTCKYSGTTSGHCGSNIISIGQTCNTGCSESFFGNLKKCYNWVPGTDNEEFFSITKDYYEEYECPEVYKGLPYKELTIEEKEDTSDGGTLAEDKKKEAIQKTHEEAENSVGEAIGKVEYINDDKYSTDKKLSWETINGNGGITNDSIKGSSGTVEAKYQYSPQKVCINLKTSEVTYGDKCVVDKEKGNVKIENGTTYDQYLGKTVTYWHYFIPLNMKSDVTFPLKVTGNSDRTLNINECESIMKDKNSKTDYYTSYIVPLSGGSQFKGDYNPNLKQNSDDYNLIKKYGGCLFTTIVNFPIEQKFYNEEDENGEKIFKGFSFYYRPIDINNPFPNGIADDSYWKQWSESNNSTPDLSKSFEKITYTAYNINASSVREYNLDNLYTSWENMNLDGSSSYISKNGIITRKEETSFYKLGCGPANKDWSECQ